jgi:hypothetical protein
MKYKAIIKRPDEQYGHVCHISTSLENLQKTVGGYIETVAAVPGVVIICNEEGKLLSLEPNIPYYHDVLCGTIIVLGIKGEEFTDCPMSFRQWKLFLEMQEQIKEGGKIWP